MIKLTPFTSSDFKRLINWIPDSAFLVQWSGTVYTFPLTEKQLEQYIKDSSTYAFNVVDEETNSVIGHISIQHDKVNNAARIGRV